MSLLTVLPHTTEDETQHSDGVDHSPVVPFQDTSREDLLHYVLNLSDSDITWILQEVSREKPHLRDGISLHKHATTSTGTKKQSRARKSYFAGILNHSNEAGIDHDACNGDFKKQSFVGRARKSIVTGFMKGLNTMDIDDHGYDSEAATSSFSFGHSPSVKSIFQLKRGKTKMFGEKSRSKSHRTKDLEDEVAMPDADASVTPIVQFSAAIYFCLENEPAVFLDVMRFGNCSGRSEVQFRTQDVTAVAGKEYVETSGTVIFEPGDFEKYIEVPIIDDDNWDTTLEFLVVLQQSGLDGAVLGRYLWQARVKIIDDDTFPTSRFKEPILEHQLHQTSKTLIYLEYVKLVWADPNARFQSITELICLQLKNLHRILNLFMEVYLVDYVLNSSFPERDLLMQNRVVVLLGMAAINVLPLVSFQIIDDVRTPASVGLLAILQRNIMRRFLDYDASSRQSISAGDLTMTTTRDATEVVNTGYMHSLKLVGAFGQLLMLLAYQLTAPAAFGAAISTSGIVFFCVCPLLMLVFLVLRAPKTTRTLNDKRRKEDACVACGIQTVSNYGLIADYSRRPQAGANYEGLVNEFRDASLSVLRLLAINEWFAPLITTLALSTYQLVGGVQVVNLKDGKAELTLGMFLTTLNVLRLVGESWSAIYTLLLEIQTTFPALERLVVLLNMPTDMAQRMALNRHRRSQTSRLRAEMRKKEFTGIPIDNLPIIVMNMDYQFHRDLFEATRTSYNSIIHKGKLHIKQGELVSLVGPIGQGKSTLLKTLGGVILPDIEADQDDECRFFIPSHLRTLHCSLEPMFFKGTLLDNLTYGVCHGDKDGKLERVLTICERLGLPESVCNRVEKQTVSMWTEVLSHAQKVLLSAARGLIANPEVLCIHKPTMVLDEYPSRNFLSLLREFVDFKGLEVDKSLIHMRRPRTCIITSSKRAGVENAHRVFHVSFDHGIREIGVGDLQDNMFF